eukprot:scaffold330281_cov62-Tisochrysis_lutea.AAC.1
MAEKKRIRNYLRSPTRRAPGHKKFLAKTGRQNRKKDYHLRSDHEQPIYTRQNESGQLSHLLHPQILVTNAGGPKVVPRNG